MIPESATIFPPQVVAGVFKYNNFVSVVCVIAIPASKNERRRAIPYTQILVLTFNKIIRTRLSSYKLVMTYYGQY